MAKKISELTEKTTIHNDDNLPIVDNEAASATTKKVKMSTVATKTLTNVASATEKTTPASDDTLHINDSAASNEPKKITYENFRRAIAAQTPGTTEANKALVVGALKEVDALTITNLTVNTIIRTGEEYGYEYDPTDPTGDFSRTGAFSLYEPGAALPESAMPDWMRPRQFVIADDGTENYELYKYDRNFRTDVDSSGIQQNAILTGADGHVVTRFPKHYIKRETLTSGRIRVTFRETTASGFALHPAYNVGGDTKNNLYIGAYPAGWYDASATAYVDGDGTNAAFDDEADKLGSVSGIKPVSNITRAQFRAAAQRVNAACAQVDIYGLGVIQGLFLLKYADFNSQNMISPGNTQHDNFVFADCINATGKSNGYGIIDTGKSIANDPSSFVNLFGLEDIFGNIWIFVDGINLNSGATYLCSNPAHYSDDVSTNYTQTAENTLTSSGQWQKALINESGVFLPKTGGAASDTFVTDYWYYASGWRVFRAGGSAFLGARAGVFGGTASIVSAIVSSAVGGRLCWKV
jgi:hypothetical protein